MNRKNSDDLNRPSSFQKKLLIFRRNLDISDLYTL